MRKLLPYEHQLVEALGVTKEEYLDFLVAQEEYIDPKIGTALDVRNTGGEAALVLTIIGILFQVGAALLAPKPEIPGSGERRNRQQRFAPSFGFNSTQELASYGDPINLVYTNQNDKGNVRVAGSLVWSAIENFGSTQFMQLMVALGASEIKKIDYEKTAFGQISLKDLNKQSVFIFAKENGVNGVPLFGDIQEENFGKSSLFPEVLKPSANDKPSCLIAVHGDRKKLGFSQAYTPTTSTSLGVFDVIPINVDVQARSDKGKEKFAPLNITLPNQESNTEWINAGTNLNKKFSVDKKIVLRFEKAGSKKGSKEARESASAIRRQSLEALDFGSTYMLGTAKFRFIQFGDNTNIETNSVFATFQCVEEGFRPTTSYDLTEPRIATDDTTVATKAGLEQAQEILRNDPLVDVTRDVNDVIISEIKRVDLLPRKESITVFDQSLGIDISFSGDISTSWENPYAIKNSFTTSKNGSIAFTEQEQRKALANPPKMTAKQARRALSDRVDALQDLISAIDTGNYDLDPGAYEEGLGDKPAGRDPDSKVNFRDPRSGDQFIGYNTDCVGTTPTRNDGKMPYNLHYIGADNTNYFFWFTGIQRKKSNTDNPKFFPEDGKLNNLRESLALKLRDRSDNSAGADTLTQKYTNITNEAKRPDQAGDGKTGKNLVLNKDSELEIYNYIDNAIGAEDGELQNLRTQINERVLRNLSVQKKEARKIIRADIKKLKNARESIPAGEDIPDPAGAEAIEQLFENLIQEKNNTLLNIDNILSNWDFYVDSLDNSFFLKCLVKSEEASYNTLSACNSVKFSLKSRLNRRISGRQKKYSDQPVEDYSASDNGVKSRLAFFRVSYKKFDDQKFKIVPVLFAIRRGSDADFYTQLNFYCETLTKWQFKFDPVFDPQAENRRQGFDDYAMIENTTDIETVTVSTSGSVSAVFSWFGKTVSKDQNTQFPKEEERGPARTNEWDLFSVNSDTQVQFSFESGPEINLTAVTEQQVDTAYTSKYDAMTMMSLGIFAGRGIESLRSVTALVTHGKLCRTVESPNRATASSSYAPDIFVDTLLDPTNGVGKYITRANIDTVSLQLAKDFCTHNNLPKADGTAGGVQMFMDGIIADAGSWREFWINAASFSLLELARKNGKDTLVPAVPCNDEGVAADSAGRPVIVAIRALFTTGNILEGSYKEEFLNYDTSTEDLIASVIYRDYNKNEMFSQKRSVNVKLKNVGEEGIRETFDLSEFVTQREQAIMFGKLLCNQRRHIRKGIEFKTLPFEAGLEPGAFIYVDVGLKDWDQYSSGVVIAGGALNSPLASVNEEGVQGVGTKTFNFLLYKPSTGEVQSKTASVTTTNKGISTASGLSGYKGWMFVMGSEKPNRRVFRVTELALEEEGELSVKAVEYPCFEEAGGTRAHIADFRSSKFKVS